MGDRGGDGYGDNNRVYVGNLSFRTSWQNLKDHMRSCGTVVHADVLREPDGRSKGCGVVEFSTAEEARRAIVDLTDSELDGRKIWLREDRNPRPARSSRGGGDYGRGGSDYGRGGGSGGGGYNRGEGRSGSAGAPCPHIYVGNLPFSYTSDALYDLFQTYGEVVDAQVKMGSDGRSKGFGLVSFKSVTEAEDAIHAMDRQNVEGRSLVVHFDRDA